MFNYKEELKKVILNEYWTTKNGTRIKIKNMNIKHLKNCINLCKRNNLKNNVRKLECALAIKQYKYNEFFEKDQLTDLVKIYIQDDLLGLAEYKDRIAYERDIKR